MRVDEWVRWGVEYRRWSGTTPRLYRTRALAAHSWMRRQGWHGLSRGLPEHYRAWWSSLPDTAGSRNLGRKVLVAYGDWLVATGQRTSNPADGIPHWRPPRTIPQTPSEAEARRIAALVASTTSRPAVAVALMMYLGTRISETQQLQWRDVDEAWVTVAGKGGVQRALPVPPALRTILRRWRLACPDGVWVLPGRDGPVSTGWLRREVVALTGHKPHSYRHLAATELLDRSRDLELVRGFLGHSSLQTTQVYLHTRPGRLADAVGLMYGT